MTSCGEPGDETGSKFDADPWLPHPLPAGWTRAASLPGYCKDAPTVHRRHDKIDPCLARPCPPVPVYQPCQSAK
jgi:hypothetical protein